MNNNQNNINNSSNNLYLTIVIILCTSLIILTNYISSKNSTKNIHNQLMQNEYNKIGGKDNYDILNELQKKEILGYLDTIKKEKPELIKEIKNKINAYEKNHLFMENQKINDLKNNSYIKGNTGALISIIEFSDLECEYCIDFHKSNIIEDIINKYPDNINYIFKLFPLPNHTNSQFEAEASECVKQLSDGKTYLDFINKIFYTTKGGGEGLETSRLGDFALELGINKIDFENCLNNGDFSKNIENDFNQAIELGINSVPSTIILNNKNGEYILLKEKPNKETIEEIITDFINQ